MIKIKSLISLGILIPLFNIAQCYSTETGSALKNDTLRKEAFADAKTNGNLVRGEQVEILKKQGAWLEIKTKKSTGWVRLLSVKRGVSSSSNNAAGVLSLASGRAGTGQVVSTTGVRGLSEQELKAAKFNEDEIKLMESYTVSKEDGLKFAQAGKLEAISFKTLNPKKGNSK